MVKTISLIVGLIAAAGAVAGAVAYFLRDRSERTNLMPTSPVLPSPPRDLPVP